MRSDLLGCGVLCQCARAVASLVAPFASLLFCALFLVLKFEIDCASTIARRTELLTSVPALHVSTRTPSYRQTPCLLTVSTSLQ